MYSTLKLSCAGETAAKAALSQNDADRGLNNPQLNRNLILRLAFVAQRFDLLGQLRVDDLTAHGDPPKSKLLGGCSMGELASCLHTPGCCLPGHSFAQRQQPTAFLGSEHLRRPSLWLLIRIVGEVGALD